LSAPRATRLVPTRVRAQPTSSRRRAQRGPSRPNSLRAMARRTTALGLCGPERQYRGRRGWCAPDWQQRLPRRRLLVHQTGTTWAQQDELTANDGAANDFFGSEPGTVGLSGYTVIVGSPQHQVGGNMLQGTAYIFVAQASDGTTCTISSNCTSTFCVDGVCCDTTCGDGLATDCQSCLGAMTGGADGTCGTVTAAANYTCRPSTGPCDPAGVCDGSSPSCPADTATPDGGCVSSSSSASSSSSSSGAGSFHLTGGCDCRAVPDRGDGRDATRAAWLALGLGLAIGRRRRCRAARS